MQITTLEEAGYVHPEIFDAMKKNNIGKTEACDTSKLLHTIVNGRYLRYLNIYIS